MKISKILQGFEFSSDISSVKQTKTRLKWPLAQSETKSLLEEVRKQRETPSLALNADELSALVQLLARQDVMGDDLSALKKGMEEDRRQRKEVRMSKYNDTICTTVNSDFENRRRAIENARMALPVNH